MKENSVLYSSENKIARITLNRPHSFNAINRDMIRELGVAFDKAQSDEMVNVVILSGQGNAFCAGADVGLLKELSEATSTEVYRVLRELNRVAKKLIQFPKPLLTAVNGAALGGGCCFALAGDVVIATEEATFGFLFSRFNLIADLGSSFILPRLAGPLRTRDLIFSGRIFSAKEAEEYGLISEVVEKGSFEKRVMSRAVEMTGWPTEAVAMNKWLLEKAESGCDPETLLELEARTQVALFGSATTRKKINEFLERKNVNK